MTLTLEQLCGLPSTFYRVAVKAIIKDDQDRLLLVQNSDGTWELPGGGWEHDETLTECLERETQEETGVALIRHSDVRFVYTGQSNRGL